MEPLESLEVSERARKVFLLGADEMVARGVTEYAVAAGLLSAALIMFGKCCEPDQVAEIFHTTAGLCEALPPETAH